MRHRRLSAELRQLREAAGLDTLETAQRMGWDRSKVNRIERSQWKRLKEDDIRGLCTLYGVTDEGRVNALVSMAKQAKETGWWVRYSDVLGPGSFVSLEAQASTLRFYGGMLIPGLLQTPSYCKALIRGVGVVNEEEIKRRVEARMARKEILERTNPPSVQAIVDEAALRKLVGSTLTMREQLLHLMLVNEQQLVDVRVLPDAVGAHPAMVGHFTILDFPHDDQSTVVFLDISREGLFMEEPEDIRGYTMNFDSLTEMALSPEASNDHLAHLVDELAE
ncbi:helix-turn-helix transcriptional regulator [Nocardiopsis rhodophaea]|uniref:Helix-turn-helix transcriptional regulator n=1 Tax=Nocardiopsis rhodophaea TaxID=280238 RepID=A0ABP5F4D5_9ACTN